MGRDTETGSEVFEEDNSDLKSISHNFSSLSGSVSNICWVNIKGENPDSNPADENKEMRSEPGVGYQQPHKSDSMKSEKIKSGFGCIGGLMSILGWIFEDFRMRHLICIKLVFLFQSASMTVLYPYINLHMKSLGMTIEETAIVNAVIPVLFIFTPPLAGFLADKIGNFRLLLCFLTGSGGLVSLLLLQIPTGRDVSLYPDKLTWGLSCGPTGSRAQYQNLILQGFSDDKCDVRNSSLTNASFTPGVCGYICPTRSRIKFTPRFFEYKVVWPNRGGGFGITEIVDVVNLQSEDARKYHEPRVLDNSIFFPMNWTFQLTCDRIRPDDCVFNPVSSNRLSSNIDYNIKLNNLQVTMKEEQEQPQFVVESIFSSAMRQPVTKTINCGSKAEIAQVLSTVETSLLAKSRVSPSPQYGPDVTQLDDMKLNDCSLICLVNFDRDHLCSNTQELVSHDPGLTFWTYLLVRTLLGVLTAASLMMFEGAVMATIQEMGGDYGLQRFVGNFGAIIFAPLGGYLIDYTSQIDITKTHFEYVFYVYLVLKLLAAGLILFIRLDFKPPGEKVVSNVKEILQNVEVVVFLGMMMFAGVFWGFIEGFLFWFLDDINASKLQMGWTVTIGMVTSLPFLVFSGPITDLVGHINVMILGMVAYTVRMIGYSFLQNPTHVYPYEALEGFTMALMMTSAVTYVAKISTPTTIASVMGLMGSLFFGIGKGSGSLFGGLLMSRVGTRWTFRLLAGVAGFCAVGYTAFQIVFVKPRRSKEKLYKPREATVKPVLSVDETDATSSESEARSSSVQFSQHQEGSVRHTEAGPRSLTGGTRV